MEMRAVHEPQYQRIGIYITEGNGYATRLEFKAKTKKHEFIEPAFTAERKENFQEFFDDLWSMGLRPSARSDEYKAQLGTMRDHLNDMRAIVFKKRENLT